MKDPMQELTKERKQELTDLLNMPMTINRESFEPAEVTPMKNPPWTLVDEDLTYIRSQLNQPPRDPLEILRNELIPRAMANALDDALLNGNRR